MKVFDGAGALFLGGYEVLSGEAQNLFHEFTFGLGVGVAVGGKSRRQFALSSGIGICILYVRAKIVSECDVARVLRAIVRANVEVMSNIVLWSAEGFAAFDSQVTLMLVA